MPLNCERCHRKSLNLYCHFSPKVFQNLGVGVVRNWEGRKAKMLVLVLVLVLGSGECFSLKNKRNNAFGVQKRTQFLQALHGQGSES